MVHNSSPDRPATPAPTRSAGPALPTSGSRLRWPVLAILCLAAAISLAAGIRNGLHHGMDFQWSGAHLLSQRIDPWSIYLQGNPGHLIILTQDPDYLHELYVLMLPLGRLSFPDARAWWCATNVLFLAISLVLVARLYRLSHTQLFLLGTLMLMSGPVRVVLLNGQQSFFVLLCFALAFTSSRTLPRGVAFGMGLAKYSFAPVIVMVSLMRLRLKLLLSVAIPILVGLLIVWRITGTSLLTLAVEPFQVAHHALAIWPGYGDIMSAVQLSIQQVRPDAPGSYMLIGLLGILSALGFALFLVRRRFDPGTELALIALASLICFTHSIYDYVFLVFPLAILLRRGFDRSRANIAGWAAILYLLFFGIVQTYLHLYGKTGFVLSNLLALSVLIASIVTRAGSIEASLKHTPSSPPYDWQAL